MWGNENYNKLKTVSTKNWKFGWDCWNVTFVISVCEWNVWDWREVTVCDAIRLASDKNLNTSGWGVHSGKDLLEEQWKQSEFEGRKVQLSLAVSASFQHQQSHKDEYQSLETIGSTTNASFSVLSLDTCCLSSAMKPPPRQEPQLRSGVKESGCPKDCLQSFCHLAPHGAGLGFLRLFWQQSLWISWLWLFSPLHLQFVSQFALGTVRGFPQSSAGSVESPSLCQGQIVTQIALGTVRGFPQSSAGSVVTKVAKMSYSDHTPCHLFSKPFPFHECEGVLSQFFGKVLDSISGCPHCTTGPLRPHRQNFDGVSLLTTLQHSQNSVSHNTKNDFSVSVNFSNLLKVLSATCVSPHILCTKCHG